MTETIHLRLPYIAAAQAQKHVTHNEALRALDAIVMLSVLDRDLSAPPASPEEGARYLVRAPGVDAFAGKDGQIAHFRDGACEFLQPRTGWTLYVADEDALLVHDGAGWRPLLGDAPELQNLARIGLATAADATNPFAARLNNALFTARAVADGGDGDLRCKLNKESAGNTASLIWQTAYSGRAEIGLTGDDDLHLRVSADGTTWRDGLVIAAATGKVSFPQGAPGLREKLLADRIYYVRLDGNDANDGLADTAVGAFATLQHAADVVFGTLDLGGRNVTVRVADGTYSEGARVEGAQVGKGRIAFVGNAAAPANVIVTSATGYTFRADAGARYAVQSLEVRSTGGGCLLAVTAGAVIWFSNLRFGASFSDQIRVGDHSSIIAEGNYAIVGGATQHWGGAAGSLRVQNRTITLSGTPYFSNAFANADVLSSMFVNGNTFSGAATGKRYRAASNAAILTNGAGASYLPGDVAGTTETGGVYA